LELKQFKLIIIAKLTITFSLTVPAFLADIELATRDDITEFDKMLSKINKKISKTKKR